MTRQGRTLHSRWSDSVWCNLIFPRPPPSQPRLGTQLSQSRVFLLSLSSQTRTKDHTRFQRNLPAPLVSLVTVLRVLTSHWMQWWAAVMSCSPAPPTAGPAFRVLAQPTAVHMYHWIILLLPELLIEEFFCHYTHNKVDNDSTDMISLLWVLSGHMLHKTVTPGLFQTKLFSLFIFVTKLCCRIIFR